MGVENIKVFQDFGKASLEIIEEFEKKKGIQFPKAYKSFISQHNGAYLENENFPFFCTRQNLMDISSIYFLGFGSKEGLISSSEDIVNSQNYDVYGYDGLITFGSNGGGDYICFDYRNVVEIDSPKVLLMLHDEYDEKRNKMITFPVAESFECFCDLLYEEIYEN